MRYTVTRTRLNSATPFLLDDVKRHARVDGDYENLDVQRMADTAAAEIEGYSDLALLGQVITVTLRAWSTRIPLPIGPFWAGGQIEHPITVELIDEAGNITAHPPGWWIEGQQHPVLNLTTSAHGSALRISYPAGFGDKASLIPADLQLAINDHAARLYDLRGSEDGAQGLSLAAARISARYRRVKV